jgi:isopenicillin N synthase-like dioxygenase
MIPYTPPRPVEALPVVDIAGGRDHAAAEEIRRACLDTGFFLVANHGVPPSLVEGQFEWSRRFFALPAEEKQALNQAHSPFKRGYESSGLQALDEGSAPDLKESFRCGLPPAPNHPHTARGLPTYGPSQWPASLPGLRQQTEAYARAMAGLGDRILALIALSLELPADFFVTHYRDPMATVRLLRYPPQPPDARGNQLGAGAHTDWGGITILAQDAIGGLEVRDVTGAWIAAHPVPGTFVVNIGEMLARWTNQRYRSNMHRVRNKAAGRDRYSIAFFYDPEYFARIEALSSCLAPGEAPLDPPCTSGEHIAEMHRRTAAALAS